jgi:hypothetical protein
MCPRCGAEVGATWRWCLACGYDPDGSALRVRHAAVGSRYRRGRLLPLGIVLAGLLVGGLILWRTTAEQDPDTDSAPRPSYDVTTWTPFRPPSGAFDVDLPGPPQAQPLPPDSSTIGRLLEDYSVDQGPVHVRALVFDTTVDGVPPTDEPDAQVLDIFAPEMAAAYQGRVDTVRTADVGRHPGNEFTVIDGMRGPLHVKAVLAGNFLYAVAVAGEDVPDRVVRHVFDSFRVTS